MVCKIWCKGKIFNLDLMVNDEKKYGLLSHYKSNDSLFLILQQLNYENGFEKQI